MRKCVNGRPTVVHVVTLFVFSYALYRTRLDVNLVIRHVDGQLVGLTQCSQFHLNHYNRCKTPHKFFKRISLTGGHTGRDFTFDLTFNHKQAIMVMTNRPTHLHIAAYKRSRSGVTRFKSGNKRADGQTDVANYITTFHRGPYN